MTTSTVDLGYRPRKWQEECHLTTKRFSVIVVHRRAGKTKLACMKLIDAALKSTRSDSMFAYVAPQLKQARSVAWSELRRSVGPLIPHGVCETNETDSMVKFNNGALIRVFGANDPDALRGLGLDGVVIDEVAQIDPEVWTEIIQPTLADRLGWAVFIGTPKGINLFSQLYYKAVKDQDWYTKRLTVYETNALDAKEVERQRLDMPESQFAREYLCDFSSAGPDQLISLTDVELAATRVFQDGEVAVEDAPKIIGVDPARFGDDRSVIIRRQGLQAFPPMVMQGIDNMALADRVAGEMSAWEPDAVFIDSGAGGGVIDRLRQLHHDVIEVPFGGKAIASTKYQNRRTEMWFGMRDWIMAGGAIPNDLSLKTELATPVYWFDGYGKQVLESKDDIKKRLAGRASPDLADALALTFASPVVSKFDRQNVRPQQRMSEYDPFAYRQ